MAEEMHVLRNELLGLQKKYVDIEETNKNLNERILELYSLYQISLTLSLSLDLDEILKSIKKLIKKSFNVDQYSIMLYDEEADELTINSSYGLSRVDLSNNFKYGVNIFGVALEREEMIYISDMSKVKDFEFYPNGNGRRTGSFLTIPLKPSHDLPLGLLNLYRKEKNSFSSREIKLFNKIAEQIAKVIEKTLIFRQTREMSITDELTGIYNRRYFNQRFEREVVRAKRYKRPMTLLMIDIDYFKNYNDVNGHLLGDEVLKKVALLLENNIRKADILARYGGEEFVVLLPEIDKEHADTVAEKLRRTVENTKFPEEYKQPNHKITISLGMATLLEDTYSSDELIKFADKALYKAKAFGRNRIIGYYPGLDDINGPSIYPLKSMAMSSQYN